MPCLSGRAAGQSVLHLDGCELAPVHGFEHRAEGAAPNQLQQLRGLPLVIAAEAVCVLQAVLGAEGPGCLQGLEHQLRCSRAADMGHTGVHKWPSNAGSAACVRPCQAGNLCVPPGCFEFGSSQTACAVQA